jgi:hypothetical protein
MNDVVGVLVGWELATTLSLTIRTEGCGVGFTEMTSSTSDP